MLDTILEYTAVAFSLLYLILISRKHISGWFFGISASGIMMYSFFKIHLNAEAFLMLFYIGAGIYGWISWAKGDHNQAEQEKAKITEWPLAKHALFILACTALSGLIFIILEQIPNSAKPELDSLTTGFAILTTFMVAIRELHNWIYWMVINSVSIYLYHSKGMDLYVLVAIISLIMSFYGYYQWTKLYRAQKA